MKILADESVDIPVFEFLRKNGFDIEHISFFSSGSPDTDVLDYAYKKHRVLLTVDKDFGELAFRTKKRSRGIVLYRLSGLNNQGKAEIILRVFKNRKINLSTNFTVVTKSQIRVRKLLF